jgi:hypothetical protein
MVPVCRVHHRELHRLGDEAAWWRRLNIDPLPIALRLWHQTRGVLSDASTKIPDALAHDHARTSAGKDSHPESPPSKD